MPCEETNRTFDRFRRVGHRADRYGCFWDIIMSMTDDIITV